MNEAVVNAAASGFTFTFCTFSRRFHPNEEYNKWFEEAINTCELNVIRDITKHSELNQKIILEGRKGLIHINVQCQ